MILTKESLVLCAEFFANVIVTNDNTKEETLIDLIDKASELTLEGKP